MTSLWHPAPEARSRPVVGPEAIAPGPVPRPSPLATARGSALAVVGMPGPGHSQPSCPGRGARFRARSAAPPARPRRRSGPAPRPGAARAGRASSAARLRAIVKSQVRTAARGSQPAAPLTSRRKVSWVRSSAHVRSPVSRSRKEWTGVRCRSMSVSKARASPRWNLRMSCSSVSSTATASRGPRRVQRARPKKGSTAPSGRSVARLQAERRNSGAGATGSRSFRALSGS